MQNKIKHLEMIETIIERMAKNSFQLKGWTVTLVTLVNALAAKDSDKRFIILSIIPIFGFWVLDAIYLRLERKYKILYAQVAKKKEEEIDFNLNTELIDYSECEKRRICFFKCFISKSEIPFYLTLIGTILILFFLIF